MSAICLPYIRDMSEKKKKKLGNLWSIQHQDSIGELLLESSCSLLRTLPRTCLLFHAVVVEGTKVRPTNNKVGGPSANDLILYGDITGSLGN